MKDLLPKLHGCIAGLAIGDAMGMPGELIPEMTRAQYGKIETFIEPAADHSVHAGLKAGQVTDDTLQALAIIKSIVRTGFLSSEDVARSLIEWIDESDGLNLRWVGPSTKQAIENLKQGVSYEEAGRRGWTNGAAMRIAPVGFLHPGDLSATVEAARLASLPTHATNTAISGAAAVACAVNQCTVDGSTVSDIIEAAKAGANLGERLGYPYMSPSISRRIDFAVSLVSQDKSVEERQRDLYDLVGTGLASCEIVPVSLALFAMADGDPMQTIILAANTGGDCDTMGAIGGAIAGAYRGISAFPPEHVRTIEQVNALDLQKISLSLLEVIQRPAAKSPNQAD